MRIVLSDLPKHAHVGLRAIPFNIHSYLGESGYGPVMARSARDAEVQVPGAGALIVFPEFVSEHAERLVKLAHENGVPVIFWYCGGGTGAHLSVSVATRDYTISQQAYAEQTRRLGKILGQLQAE